MFHKKQIFKLNVLKNLVKDENSCVSLVPSTRLLALPPFFLNDMKSGILYQLNTMLKKYDRSLGGIVIGYQNIKVLMDDNTGIIPIGCSETEVNISVEFYIFQPKIGSYLEGVINKKSNTHIGCLVHQHFNATILKQEDVEYEDWDCKIFNVDDKIIFKVIDLDFTTLLPYIEGAYDGGISLDKAKSKPSQNCDINNQIDEDSLKSCHTEAAVSYEVPVNTIKSQKTFKEDLSNNKKGEKKIEAESFLKDNTKNSLDENDSFTKKSVKKKKKNKEKLEYSNLVEKKEDKQLPPEEMEDNILYSTQLEPNIGSKKLTIFCSPIPHGSPTKGKAEIKNTNLESSTFLRNEINLNPDKVQKEIKTPQKKRKKEEKESSEDSPRLKKFKTSHTSSSGKDKEENLNGNEVKSLLRNMMEEMFSKQLNRVKEELNMSSSDKETCKEGKKKHKSKKKDLDESLVLNKGEKLTVNGDDKKSQLQSLVDELCKLQIQRVKEELNISDRESSKASKKKKVKEHKPDNEVMKEDTGDGLNRVVVKRSKGKKRLSFSDEGNLSASKGKKVKKENEDKTKNVLVNGDSEKSDVQNTLDELCKIQLERVKEKLNMSDRENLKETQKKKAKGKKGENGLSKQKTRETNNEDELKSDVQHSLDELLRPQVERVTGELSTAYKDTLLENNKKQAKRSKEKNEVLKSNTKEESYQVHDKNSEKSAVDKFCHMRLERVEHELRVPDKESLKETKKSKSRKKNVDIEKSIDKVNKNPDVQTTLDELYKQQLQRVKEELSMSDRESIKETKKKKVKEKRHDNEVSKEKKKDKSNKSKKNKNAQNSSVNENETSNSQSASSDLQKQVIITSKDKSESGKEKKKKKSASEKQKKSECETNDSLYYKLLKEARNAMDLG